MANYFLEHVRSLEELYDLIQRDRPAGIQAATEQLLEDVKSITDKINSDARNKVDDVVSWTKKARKKLTAEATAAVSKIRKNATQARPGY